MNYIVAQSDFLQVFSNFWRFWCHKKDHIFLITHDKFYSCKVFYLEDTNENVPGYGNIDLKAISN